MTSHTKALENHKNPFGKGPNKAHHPYGVGFLKGKASSDMVKMKQNRIQNAINSHKEHSAKRAEYDARKKSESLKK